MKAYLFMIRSRLKSHNWIKLLFAWHILLIRKMLKKEFNTKAIKKGRIDLVIPTISKDFDLVKAVIEAAVENLNHEINKIYIVSKKDKFITEFCLNNGYIFIDELLLLGYGKENIKYTVNGNNRSGWMFQQLIKLSGDKFVEMENYFIIDSDTILLNPQSVISFDNRFIFFQNEEWHEPYFRTFKKMFGYEAPTLLSYTSHMMIFNTKKLSLLKKELESYSKTSWDKAYTSTADPKEASCVSDYDNYANWMQYNFPKEIESRIFYNKGLNRKHFGTLSDLKNKYGKKFNSVSFHSYIS